MTSILLRLPTLFLSHGGPGHALDLTGTPYACLDKNSNAAAFMRSLSNKIEEFTPLSNIKAILILSAHWEEREFTVGYQNNGPTKLIYDYSGFAREAYAPYLTYPVPTDLVLADRVHQLLTANAIPGKRLDRGFDHGAFMPLVKSFPEAKIPVVQLSLKAGLDPAAHFRLGEILRPLRQEGVLIIGSGQITHNLRAMDFSGRVDHRAVDFTETVYRLLTSIRNEEDYERVKRVFLSPSEIEKTLPHFSYMHPRTEHFVPLLVAVAAGVTPSSSLASSDKTVINVNRLYSEVVAGSMAMDSYLFE